MSTSIAVDGRATETAPSTGAEAAGGGGVSSQPYEDAESVTQMAISDLLKYGMPDDPDVAARVRTIEVRGALDRERVDAYKMALARGEDLGPILVAVVDDVEYVASGWHRTVAYAESGCETVAAICRHLTMGDAVDAAIEENRRHGHSPTAADVAQSLQRMWEVHPDRRTWPNGKLADLCGVSEGTVRTAEALLPPAVREARGSKRVVVRKGKEYTQKAPVSSHRNDDKWPARTPAPGTGAAPKAAVRHAVADALRLTQEALTKVHRVGLDGTNGMPDDALADWAFGIQPSALESKAAAAEEFAAFLTAFAMGLRGLARQEG